MPLRDKAARPEDSFPEFAHDPHGWFDRVGQEVPKQGWTAIDHEIRPTSWTGERGRGWRIVRSTNGIEVRPDLVSPFIHYGEGPRVTAIAIGDELEIELTTRSGRWVDRFPLAALDIAGLGHAMLDERELAHDNLRRLFPARGPTGS